MLGFYKLSAFVFVGGCIAVGVVHPQKSWTEVCWLASAKFAL